MIISRTPFRISFAGGGSDLPSFYRRSEGAVLSTSIDKYMYIAIHPYFAAEKIQLKYSKTELVDAIHEIKHPIFREALAMYDLKGVDLNSIAHIPSAAVDTSSPNFAPKSPTAFFAASKSSVMRPSRKCSGSIRPKTRFASVIVGWVPPCP